MRSIPRSAGLSNGNGERQTAWAQALRPYNGDGKGGASCACTDKRH